MKICSSSVGFPTGQYRENDIWATLPDGRDRNTSTVMLFVYCKLQPAALLGPVRYPVMMGHEIQASLIGDNLPPASGFKHTCSEAHLNSQVNVSERPLGPNLVAYFKPLSNWLTTREAGKIDPQKKTPGSRPSFVCSHRPDMPGDIQQLLKESAGHFWVNQVCVCGSWSDGNRLPWLLSIMENVRPKGQLGPGHYC